MENCKNLNPIILPAKHYFVNLIVRDCHEKVFHGGISETLQEIRERFWLIKGRQTVKNILKKLSAVQLDFRCSSHRTVTSSSRRAVSSIFCSWNSFRCPLYTKD
ncbi:hypothetical protein TNIN_58511 [Trichonephila inaurata madagascariensis]|uniref:Integrase zinc-binding domain-containing protein n=1 Tax=Trichonephila inaurata madagascariensis TaxID=2747483 RepID=A0A8X7C3A8_9ARAC|nr:hypothetical protein TNIN_58511 [Trichonephila inaurata madagascariensis]